MNDSEQTLLDFSKYVKLTPEYLASQEVSQTFPKRFWTKVDKNGPFPDPIKYPSIVTQCWIWTAAKVKEYGVIGRGGIETRYLYSHRASWILHYGPIPDGLSVLHKCDNPPCVRPEHLWIGTNQDNRNDSVQKGRSRNGDTVGESNPRCILTTDQVISIRCLLVFKSAPKLAKIFGVSVPTIYDIKHRRSWKHI